MPRIELSHGQWADLCEVDQVPRRKARAYRDAFYASVVPAADVVADQSIELSVRSAAAGVAIIKSHGMGSVEDAINALVLAIVKDWSFGPVTLETLDDMPDDAVRTIHDKAQADGYLDTLMPSTDVDPDEGSPTTP